ncbi:retrotransposable element Tf2 protein type 1 [Trichonephila clavipes]|nr:retrotransposable element Tf2 protein type 1 [Trichonephila clavipes]
MNYYNANNEDNINVKNNKGLDQISDSPEADLKRLFNPAMVVEDTVPKQTIEPWEDLTQLLDKFQTIFSQNKQLLTSANRPQCNGKNERVNQTLVAKLRCKVNSTTKTPWTKLLEQVTYEYNNSPHDVTGFPPAYLMYGTLPYDSPLPNQVKLNYPPIQQARQIAVNRTIKHHKINKQRHYKAHRRSAISLVTPSRDDSRYKLCKDLPPGETISSYTRLKSVEVSYTTDDLLFDWEQEVPLVVDESIELPQHNLVDTSLGDCTKVYSTATRGLLATDHVILNHGQVTWTTPELAPPSPNYHTTPTGGRFSSRQI